MTLRLDTEGVRIRLEQPELDQLLESGVQRQCFKFSQSLSMTVQVKIAEISDVHESANGRELTILLARIQAEQLTSLDLKREGLRIGDVTIQCDFKKVKSER